MLQAALDMTTTAFRSQLLAAVLASLPQGLTEEDITLVIDASAGTVSVTVDHLLEAGTTADAVKAAVSANAFTDTIGSAVGASVALESAPTIASRIAPQPSPPPTTPPPPTSPSPSMPSPNGAFSVSQQQEATQDGGQALSNEMIWVIIVAVIFAVLFLGCLCAYYRGRRSGRRMSEVAIKSSKGIPKEAESVHVQSAAAAASASSASPTTPLPDVDANAVRLIGLGVALERQLSGGGLPSGGRSTPLPNQQISYPQPFSQPVAPNDLASALQSVQAANANLAYIASRDAASSDARASANLWLHDSMAAAGSSAEVSPRGSATPVRSSTPKVSASGSIDHV